MATDLPDLSRVLLATAAARESSCIFPVSNTLRTSQDEITRCITSLRKAGLIGEHASGLEESGPGARRLPDQPDLFITEAGLRAIGITNDEGHAGLVSLDCPHSSNAAPDSGANALRPSTDKVADRAASTPRSGSKLDSVVEQLRSTSGATISELITATGWQAHSIRGAISGTLKKKLKLEIVSEIIAGRGRVYRIVQNQPVGSECP